MSPLSNFNLIKPGDIIMSHVKESTGMSKYYYTVLNVRNAKLRSLLLEIIYSEGDDENHVDTFVGHRFTLDENLLSHSCWFTFGESTD